MLKHSESGSIATFHASKYAYSPAAKTGPVKWFHLMGSAKLRLVMRIDQADQILRIDLWHESRVIEALSPVEMPSFAVSVTLRGNWVSFRWPALGPHRQFQLLMAGNVNELVKLILQQQSIMYPPDLADLDITTLPEHLSEDACVPETHPRAISGDLRLPIDSYAQCDAPVYVPADIMPLQQWQHLLGVSDLMLVLLELDAPHVVLSRNEHILQEIHQEKFYVQFTGYHLYIRFQVGDSYRRLQVGIDPANLSLAVEYFRRHNVRISASGAEPRTASTTRFISSDT